MMFIMRMCPTRMSTTMTLRRSRVYSEEEEYVEEIETDYSAPETEYVETEYVETEYVETEAASSSGLGQEIVNYAAQFVGNPYVYGGTSLTEGADCSGFVQSVFANYGIYLSRVAADQAGETELLLTWQTSSPAICCSTALQAAASTM